MILSWIPALPHLAYTFSSVWFWSFSSLAIILLASGLDDLIPLLVCLHQWTLVPKKLKARPLLEGTAEPRRIAIFVPCWKESAVIGNMVRHNLAAIRYTNYDFFLGTYPNDEPTVKEARRREAFFPNVHAAVCDKPGPTSKADCLNTVFRRMTQYEAENSAHFDTIVLHDAEDMIHPDSLSLINRERFEYHMVQVPVLPIPTPISQITHGVYCDEFAEFHLPERSLVRSSSPGRRSKRARLSVSPWSWTHPGVTPAIIEIGTKQLPPADPRDDPGHGGMGLLALAGDDVFDPAHPLPVTAQQRAVNDAGKVDDVGGHQSRTQRDRHTAIRTAP